MKDTLILFDNEEVKVRTDKGETLINLVHTAKCCGVTQLGNSGKLKIRWSNLKLKLKSISSGDTNLTPQYIEEINYILDEIENTDDRNSIYMSSWLSKRLAMECNSDKARSYKNWLANLDEKYSKVEPKQDFQQLTSLVSSTVNSILPTMIQSITEQFAPIIVETKNIVEEQRKTSQDTQNNLERLIGIRSRNTQTIGKRLTSKESEFYGRRIYSTSIEHKLNRRKLLNHFDVQALEDIQARRFNDVLDYIDIMELASIKDVDKYKMSTRNKNSYKYEIQNK